MTAPPSRFDTRTMPSTPTLVHAGPLTAVFERASLRWISHGTTEVLRGIYGSVRDAQWRTIHPRVRVLALDQRDQSFHIAFEAQHVHDAVDFLWHGRIDGAADGTLRFAFDGEARAPFARNRIGLCVLHPLPGHAPLEAEADLVGGGSRQFVFPADVSPDQIALHLCRIRHDVRDGLRAELALTGETFETEDQRNWSDVSFKTYGTPVDLPRPVDLQAGTRISQSATLSFTSATDGHHQAAALDAVPAARKIWLLPGSHVIDGRPFTSTAPAVRLALTVETRPLPRVGVALANGSSPLTPREHARLAGLSLSHLHARLDLRDAGWMLDFERAAHESRVLGLPLEMAVLLSSAAPDDELEALARVALRAHASMARWMVFDGATATTPVALATAARRHLRPLAPQVPIGGGSALHFAELNRNRPAPEALDFFAYGVTPQAHDIDEATMMENIGAIGDVHRTLRGFAPGRGLVVSPVTLQPRPVEADARHASPFAAAWTIAHLAAIVEHGADAVTYFEAVGHAGVIDPAPHVERPVARVLQALGEFRGTSARLIRVSAPEAVAAFGLTDGRRAQVLVANLRAVETEVILPGEHAPVRLAPHGVLYRDLGRSLAAR